MNEPLETLAKQAVALVEKGDKAIEKGNDFYISAGQKIAECRAECRERKIVWIEFCKEHLQLSRRRADELIMIGDGGELALKKERERKKLGKREERARRRAGPDDASPSPPPRIARPQPVPDDSEPQSPDDDYSTSSEVRIRGFEYRVQESLRYAKFDDLSGLEITPEIVEFARATVAAWTKLEQRISRPEPKTGCDYDPDQKPFKGEPESAARRRAIIYRAAQSAQYATRAELDQLEIDEEIMRLAQGAVDAWTKLRDELAVRMNDANEGAAVVRFTSKCDRRRR